MFQRVSVEVEVSSYLGSAQEGLELVLRQQAVVLDERRHLRGPLRLIVHRAVHLHVAVQDLQEPLLPL